jgi:hypothetical protein
MFGEELPIAGVEVVIVEEVGSPGCAGRPDTLGLPLPARLQRQPARDPVAVGQQAHAGDAGDHPGLR